mmetsp:Transcript_18492/g.16369  ORF Transcript_18492/g.16369 Transcript_18492/m.16369 type:complete len:123 (+) Transcript_18492:531-899(+)
MDKKTIFKQMVIDFNSEAIAHLIMANMLTENQTIIGWKSNMPVLIDSATNIYDYRRVGSYLGPFKAVLSGKSPWAEQDFISSFPNVQAEDIVKIEGAGHWVQVDKPHETLKEISDFIDRMDN